MEFEFELENIHLTVLLLTALVILYSDHQGFNYMAGKTPTLSRRTILWSHRLVSLGLMLMVLTGLGLALPGWQYWIAEPAFLAKMAFVFTLIINGFAIGKLSQVASEQPFASLEPAKRLMLLISGAVSAACWIGAAVIGFIFL